MELCNGISTQNGVVVKNSVNILFVLRIFHKKCIQIDSMNFCYLLTVMLVYWNFIDWKFIGLGAAIAWYHTGLQINGLHMEGVSSNILLS